MKKIKKCLFCGRKFFDTTKNGNKKYCSLRCKERAKYKREKEARKHKPKVRCPHCNYVFQLDFDPKMQYRRFRGERCPHCKKLIAYENYVQKTKEN